MSSCAAPQNRGMSAAVPGVFNTVLAGGKPLLQEFMTSDACAGSAGSRTEELNM